MAEPDLAVNNNNESRSLSSFKRKEEDDSKPSAVSYVSPISPPPTTETNAQTTTTTTSTTNLARLEAQVMEWMTLLDPALTKAYYRALEVVPDLVRQESRIADFLRRCKQHPQDAAQRLARYWTLRKQLFGERWLLPMTQSGSGALSADDITILRSGFCKVVTSATHGTVFINDFSLLPPGTTQMQTNIAFYLATICAHEATSLFVVRSPQRPTMTMSNDMKAVKASTAGCIQNIFVARAYEEGREHLLDYLGYQQRRLTQVNFNQSPRQYIAANSMAGTLQALQAVGFDATCLPRELGGHVDQTTFTNWIRMRLSVEDILGTAPTILRQRGETNATVAALASAAASSTEGTSASTSSSSSATTAMMAQAQAQPRKVKRGREYPTLTRRPNETAAAFHKRKTACYVRRHYHRQKLEIMAVQGQAAKCRDDQIQLRAEQERLQGLWQQAQAIVQDYHQYHPHETNSHKQVVVQDEEEKDEDMPQTKDESNGKDKDMFQAKAKHHTARSNPGDKPAKATLKAPPALCIKKNTAQEDKDTTTPNAKDMEDDDESDANSLSFASILVQATDSDLDQVSPNDDDDDDTEDLD